MKVLPNTEIYLENNYRKNRESTEIIDCDRVNIIPWTEWFDTWLVACKNSLPPAKGYELSLRLTSDREIASFNSQYRKQNKPTDVLSFAALENSLILPVELTESLYLGDIIISLDTANKQANQQRHSLTRELAWLATHGLLHLLGWDHPDDYSLNLMLEKQANLLKLVENTE